MKRAMLIIGSSAMVLFFVAIMGSGGLLKKPLTGNDDVIKQINLAQEYVNNGSWDKAEEELNQGIKAWEKVKNRIQYSVERDVIEKIDSYFGELKGALKAKDENIAVIIAEKIKHVWEELGA